MVGAELHPPLLDVWAGDVEFISGQTLGILKDPDHLHIVLKGIAEDVGNDCRIEISQYREFFGDEGSDPHVLEPDGIQHSGRGWVETGGGGAFDGFAGKALGDEASEAGPINEVG